MDDGCCFLFGMKFLSWLKGDDEWTLAVAVKTLKSVSDSITDNGRGKLLQEAAIMGQFRHDNIVSLYGVILNEEPVLWLSLHWLLFLPQSVKSIYVYVVFICE